MHYEIWIEGYVATGEHGLAQKLGEAEGACFEEACVAFATPQIQKLYGSFTQDPPALWGCRLWPTESKARVFERKLGYEKPDSEWGW